MIDKIIVIPDSFKNTMDSKKVCSIIYDTLKKEDGNLNVSVYPVADGGEGTAIIFSEYLKLNIKKMRTTNAYNKEIEIEYGSNGHIGVLDIASVVGFLANEGEQLNPQLTTTYGVGVVLKKMIEIGHKKIYVGLGGSITNDLGCGMMSALGVVCYDENDEVFVPCGKTLKKVKKIDASNLIKFDGEIICLSDVKSPLFGSTGAARMFARQKGADDLMIEELENDAHTFVEMAKKSLNDCSEYPGSGAAGGLGYAFKTFFGAQIVSGINEILKISNVEENIDSNSLIITGEGCFDKQSLEGKVISGVVEMSKKKKARVIIVAGCAEEDVELDVVEKVFVCSKKGRGIEDVKKTCHLDLMNATKKVYQYLKNK